MLNSVMLKKTGLIDKVYIKKAMKGNDCDWDLLNDMCFGDAEWYIEGGNGPGPEPEPEPDPEPGPDPAPQGCFISALY